MRPADGSRPSHGGARMCGVRGLVALSCALVGCGPGDDGGKPPVTSWQFTDVGAAALGAWRHVPVHEQLGGVYDRGCGLAAGDIDGDGHEDLVLLDQCGPTGYFLGNGDGTFRDASSRLAMLDDGVRVGVTYGDFDNDGRADLYVTFVRRPNALLHQNADGSFTDVAAERGVARDGHYSGAVFVDVNGDGYLDLLVAGNIRYTGDLVTDPDPARRCPAFHEALDYAAILQSPSDASALFINSGPARGFAFTDEAAARGIPPGGAGDATRAFSDATAADLDRDGRPDLILTEMLFGKTALLHNDGTGHFTDVTAAFGVRPSFGPPATTVADYDNDGWPDLFMTDMISDMWIEPGMGTAGIDGGVRYRGELGPASGEGDNPTGPIFGNSLWMGVDGRTLQEAALSWHAETFSPWGNLPADFNNDGDVDVFVPSGMSNPYDYLPNKLLVNRGGRFEALEGQVGLDPPPGKAVDPGRRVLGQPYVSGSRAAAVADFDENGTLDLVVLNWNNRPNVFRDDLPAGSHWLEVDLVGTAPRDPFGASVEVKAGGRTLVRWMQGAAGFLSQSTRWVHFGLGAAQAIDSVVVKWPDGTTTSVDGVHVDSRITVRHQ